MWSASGFASVSDCKHRLEPNLEKPAHQGSLNAEPIQRSRPGWPHSWRMSTQSPSFNWPCYATQRRKSWNCPLSAKYVIWVWCSDWLFCLTMIPAKQLHPFDISRIRFCDKNTVDVAQLRSEMDGFLNRISALFLQRKAGHVHSYTRHVSHQK